MYLDVIPSFFENTTMKKRLNDETGALISYRITPCDGYVIHTKHHDFSETDEITGEETGEILLGYTKGLVMVGYNYNFETNPFEIYAVLESEVPKEQIFDSRNNSSSDVIEIKEGGE